MAKRGPIIYRTLVTEIIAQEMRREEVAAGIGVSYNTLNNKLRGHTPFTLDEAMTLKALLDYDGTLEELFAKREADPENKNNRKG